MVQRPDHSGRWTIYANDFGDLAVRLPTTRAAASRALMIDWSQGTTCFSGCADPAG